MRRVRILGLAAALVASPATAVAACDAARLEVTLGWDGGPLGPQVRCLEAVLRKGEQEGWLSAAAARAARDELDRVRDEAQHDDGGWSSARLTVEAVAARLRTLQPDPPLKARDAGSR